MSDPDSHTQESLEAQPVPRSTSEVTNQSGGVSVDAEQLNVGQDVVGRDKIISIYNDSPLSRTLLLVFGMILIAIVFIAMLLNAYILQPRPSPSALSPEFTMGANSTTPVADLSLAQRSITPIPSSPPAAPAAMPRGTVSLEPSSTLTVVITALTGEESQLMSLEIGQVYYSPGSLSPERKFFGTAGIPLENGVSIAFQYIDRAEFYKDSENHLAVDIKLITGIVVDKELGSFATTVQGETVLGKFEMSLASIEKIVVQRSKPLSSLPTSLPPGKLVTVLYRNGESTQIINPVFNTSYVVHCNGLCADTCYNYDVNRLPMLQGIEVELERIKEVEFQNEEGVYNPIKVKITSLDGQSFVYDLAEKGRDGELYEPCPTFGPGRWWIKGESILGDFAVPVILLSKMTFDER